MSIEFRPAKRENVPLLLGLAGGTGSGKTMSALRLARGIAQGQPIAAIDTENGRMHHYADRFPELMIAELKAPFRPQAYAEAIEAAQAFLEKQGVPVASRVVVVDSASHEWYGDGGCLDWHDELMGGDQKKNLSAWIEPKREHKKMVTRLLQLEAHVILCFRAEPKVEAVREGGQTKIVPKPSITGLDGWIPIAEKNLPYELTLSWLLMADAPGKPRWIKKTEELEPLVNTHLLDEATGTKLAEWARGSGQADSPSGTAPAGAEGVPSPPAEALTPAEFKERYTAAGISPQQVGAKGRELFPGRSSASLSDRERGQLWNALNPQEALV